jgi:hypothetical protein
MRREVRCMPSIRDLWWATRFLKERLAGRALGFDQRFFHKMGSFKS